MLEHTNTLIDSYLLFNLLVFGSPENDDEDDEKVMFRSDRTDDTFYTFR